MKPVTEIDRKFEDGTDGGSVGAASVDPVCGMTVNSKSGAGSAEYDGRTYYFCSSHCLNKFREDPQRYFRETLTCPSAIYEILLPFCTPDLQCWHC